MASRCPVRTLTPHKFPEFEMLCMFLKCFLKCCVCFFVSVSCFANSCKNMPLHFYWQIIDFAINLQWILQMYCIFVAKLQICNKNTINLQYPLQIYCKIDNLSIKMQWQHFKIFCYAVVFTTNLIKLFSSMPIHKDMIHTIGTLNCLGTQHGRHRPGGFIRDYKAI